MTIKPNKPGDCKEVTYTTSHWMLLRELRDRAAKVMTALEEFHLAAETHGSVARGDVKRGSDVDVFIPEVQNSFLVEIALEKAQIPVRFRLIVQATPAYAMKAHIGICESVTVSFPLMHMRRVEREFYRFGGEINLRQLKVEMRVAGVDKRLMLIEPTETGHLESNIIGREQVAAKFLGVSAETVLDRVHTLVKRDAAGRTGVFLKKELAPDETFELALKKLADSNPAVRCRIKKSI